MLAAGCTPHLPSSRTQQRFKNAKRMLRDVENKCIYLVHIFPSLVPCVRAHQAVTAHITDRAVNGMHSTADLPSVHKLANGYGWS